MSQCDRVLAVLADGQPHTIEEIHARAGTMRLNSRAAEIRKRLRAEGRDLACWSHTDRNGRTYVYQIVGALEREAVSEPSAASPSSALTEEARVGGDGGSRATNSVAQPGAQGANVAQSVREADRGSSPAGENGKAGQEVGLTARASSVSALVGRESPAGHEEATHHHSFDIPAGIVSHKTEARSSRPTLTLNQLAFTGASFRREPKA